MCQLTGLTEYKLHTHTHTNTQTHTPPSVMVPSTPIWPLDHGWDHLQVGAKYTCTGSSVHTHMWPVGMPLWCHVPGTERFYIGDGYE